MNLALIDIYHQFHFEIVEQLINRQDINISYAIKGVPHNFHGDQDVILNISKKIFQNSKTNTFEDFFYPDQINKLAKYPFLVTNDLLEEYSNVEMTFLKMSDRSTAIPTSVHQRRKYYQLLLNYFLNIIEEYSITHAFAFDTPHAFFSGIFHEVLKKKGIPVVRVEHHYLADYSLVLDTFEMPEIPQDYMKDASVAEIRGKVPEHLLGQVKDKSYWIEDATEIESRQLVSHGLFGDIRLASKFAMKYIINLIIGIFPFIYKKHIRHFTSLNNIHNEFKYRRTINKKLYPTYQQNRFYNKIAKEQDLSKPYVFYGLHMQPEKTTLPLGRQMDHHLSSIIILSQSIPDGWSLYIKEHPNQFNVRKIANQNFRDLEFYKTVLELPNAYFIPLRYPAEDLISNAKIVATLTGTVGWEGIQRGIPVIAFGDAYYRACRGSRTVGSVPECKRAIVELLDLTEEDFKKEIYRYLAYYTEAQLLVRSGNDETKIPYGSQSRTEQCAVISDIISDRLASVY